ncbi:MAG: T9SS type A sorting domain-containing protein [Lewinellaceae bacterium]|nr:zinc-dependent metalloprotease [Saprospiraceae bacterium]MCB9341154.1 T9SS type A sorting domain-containing protein [Lewinellaceae bacterium]
MKLFNCFLSTRLLTLAILFSTLALAQAQQREPLQQAKKSKATTLPSTIVSPFTISPDRGTHSNIVEEATYLNFDAAMLQSALKNQPREILFRIPQQNGSNIELLLERQEILAPDFKVTNEKGVEIPYQAGNYYTGQVLDRGSDGVSFAALSVTGGEVMAMMSIEDKNFVLGAMKPSDAGRHATSYVFYNDEKLKVANPNYCGASMEEHLKGNGMNVNVAEMAGAKNIVKVQFEADFRTYQDNGSSVANVTNFVTGLFNMVATIYHNEGITAQISQVLVWTVADPYPINASSTSGDVLNKFYAQKNATGINGNLAHLISTKPVGHGGIAWIDVLCHPTIGYHTAYSNISNTYNNFPLYSWTIDVVTHEMGHNLGSPHTHDCVWGAGGNQALDNCFATSGGCAAGPAPVNGGTIMSYCHLTAAGKNFNLGFGTQPGNLIRSKVAAASCLSKSFLDCATAQNIYCGVPVNGTTIGGVNNVTTYGCNSWVQSGPEKVYILQTTETTTITATLSNLTADLDVIILDACSESNCLAEGNNSATVANATPGMYFIVVDGFNGAKGDFTLSVNCSGYCFTTGLTNYEFINRVQLGTIDNLSGNNYGYADFTNIGTPLHRGGSVDFTLTPGFITGSWSEYWRIWIDINKDDDFNDPGELVYSSPSGSSTATTGTLNIPANAALGKTRMRVAMRFGSLPTACGTFSGEVEDYTVDIQPYCPSLGNTKYEYVQAVGLNGAMNVSGNNGGYADFTTSLGPLDILKGDSNEIYLRPGFNGSAYGENWKVWIDMNQDFNFDASELVFATTSPSSTPVTGSFIVPWSAFTGEARMRVTMFFGNDPSSCSFSFYGETEDYLVNLVPFCSSKGNSKYEFIQTVGIGSLLNESGNDGGYADFTDLPATVTAGQPTGIVLVPGFNNETAYYEYWRVWVDLNGDQLFDDTEQIFEGGPSKGLVFGAFALPDTLPSGKYGCRVSMRYGGFPAPCGEIGYGEVEDYRLEVKSGIGGQELTGPESRSDNGLSFNLAGTETGSFNLFPNPAKNLVNIAWMNMEPVAGHIVSITGQVLFSFDDSNVPNKLNISELPAGMYMLQVVTGDKKVVSQRFVKVD